MLMLAGTGVVNHAPPKASLTKVNAEPEEEGLDLNLEEMFDM